jgi:RNA polymerase sigma-70 factor, ECF subfamily
MIEKPVIQSGRSVTQLLVQWGSGDRTALDELTEIVYDELRRLAGSYLRRRGAGQTLQPTALVHEAYLLLADQDHTGWQNRAQFFGLAAKLMHDILVDRARRRLAGKRGGGQLRVSLSEADRLNNQAAMDIITLDDALKDLAEANPQHARVVEMRFFGGLTIEETAEVMGTSHATVERQWRYARAWLRRALSRSA